MSDIDDIRAGSVAIGEMVNARDAGGAAGHYADDGTVMPPGAPSVTGREAVREYWQGMIDAGLTDVTINVTDVEVAGSVAVDRGTFTARLGDQPLAGKYMLVWRRTGAGWKAQSDIFNFDA